MPKLRAAIGTVAQPGERRHRHGAAGTDGKSGDRSSDGSALRHHAGDRGQRAVRPVRATDHLHDLYAVQPVSRHHGGGAVAATVAGGAQFDPVAVIGIVNGQVPLSAIVHVEQQAGPLAIDHLGQFPATTISFDTAPGASLGAAVTDVRQAEKDIGLPESFLIAFQGAAAALEVVALQ